LISIATAEVAAPVWTVPVAAVTLTVVVVTVWTALVVAAIDEPAAVVTVLWSRSVAPEIFD